MKESWIIFYVTKNKDNTNKHLIDNITIRYMLSLCRRHPIFDNNLKLRVFKLEFQEPARSQIVRLLF